MRQSVTVITRDTAMKPILKDKLKTEYFKLHYPQQKMICHKYTIPTKQNFSLYSLAIGQKYWSFT